MQGAEDGVDFRSRALPVGRGQGKKRERVNAEAGSGGDYAPRRFSAGAVPCGTWKAARGGPTAVAIGDDSHVQAGEGLRELLVGDLLEDHALQGHGLYSFSAAEELL